MVYIVSQSGQHIQHLLLIRTISVYLFALIETDRKELNKHNFYLHQCKTVGKVVICYGVITAGYLFYQFCEYLGSDFVLAVWILHHLAYCQIDELSASAT